MARKYIIASFSTKNYADLLNLYSNNFFVKNAVTDLMSNKLTIARSTAPIKIKITFITGIVTCGFIK